MSEAGTPCRKSIDQECDFTEYCNGTSSQCVPDTYALNGNLCRLGTAYCYHGRCQTLDNQCAEIFGKGIGLSFIVLFNLNFDLPVDYTIYHTPPRMKELGPQS